MTLFMLSMAPDISSASWFAEVPSGPFAVFLLFWLKTIVEANDPKSSVGESVPPLVAAVRTLPR